MQGRNTIWALGIVDCSPTLWGILFVYLFGVIKNTMMNAYFFQMNNLKGLAADESGSSCVGRETSQVRMIHRQMNRTSSEWSKKQRRSSGQQSAMQGWSWLNSY